MPCLDFFTKCRVQVTNLSKTNYDNDWKPLSRIYSDMNTFDQCQAIYSRNKSENKRMIWSKPRLACLGRCEIFIQDSWTDEDYIKSML